MVIANSYKKGGGKEIQKSDILKRLLSLGYFELNNVDYLNLKYSQCSEMVERWLTYRKLLAYKKVGFPFIFNI